MMTYLLSLLAPSHSLELTGIGLVHVLVLVAVQSALQEDLSDQAVHPPCRTQSGFLVGSVQAGTQSSNISASPAQSAPPCWAAGLLQ